MIILDTNIISEMMKPSPNAYVSHWIDQQVTSDLFITSITIAEIAYGLKVLPNGKRRRLLENAFKYVIHEAFEYRTLDFNEQAAYRYGELMAYRRSLGQPLSICDGQIAAIALLHGYTLATRNINDFKACELELINPFNECLKNET